MKKISNVIRFMSLPKEQRCIVFYSEAASYWPHLGGLIRELLHTDLSTICYISSSPDDPGLALQREKLHTFYIGNGFIRDWLFQNIDTNYMIMTMPDLHQYQVKRSRHPVHYIYVQHSLVSLHMVYRTGAFNHYDTICCAGPHHAREIRAIEKKYSLPTKNIFEHGYSRLDSLLHSSRLHTPLKKPTEKNKKHLLVAPSWGREGLTESGLAKSLISNLLELGHFVTFRPHPRTINLAQSHVAQIVTRHKNNSRFLFEDSVVGDKSLCHSDIIISDWSGVALECAFGLQKPIIFCDIPRKINNPYYKEIDLTPIEVSIRNKIGVTWNGKEDISFCIERCESIQKDLKKEGLSKYIFNLGTSDHKFAEYLTEQIRKRK